MLPSSTPSGADSENDSTLAGYLSAHGRPPAFDGPDGYPYTVSPEVEKTSNLRAPYAGYLVFPRWALTGVGIVGHVETPLLCECPASEEAQRYLGALTLLEVQRLLSDAVVRDAGSE